MAIKSLVSNLTVNGESNPTKLLSTAGVSFGFVIAAEGTSLAYRIQVGKLYSGNFFPTVWDMRTFAGINGSGTKQFNVKYGGSTTLEQGTAYHWRVLPSDGASEGEWSDLQLFRVNRPPILTSIKVDGQEALYTPAPTTKTDNVVISWSFYDYDGASQEGFKLEVLPSSGGSVLDVEQFSSLSSVTIPTILPDGGMTIKLTVKDDVEYGRQYLAYFNASARPSVLDPKVEGKVNPTDVLSPTPTFSWRFYDVTPGDVQVSFRVQVAHDEAFSSLAWDSGAITSPALSVIYGSTPAPIVPPEALSHSSGMLYFRILASDGVSWSNNDEALGFFVINHLPGDPTLTAPSAMSYSGIMTIQWTPAIPLDQDGDPVTYFLEMTDSLSAGTGWEFLDGPLPSTATSYDLDLSDIPSGDDYGVRIIASDGFGRSDPDSYGTSPAFTIENHAPVTPVILAPKAGDLVSLKLLVEIAKFDVPDVDGDMVLYNVEITRDFSIASPIWEKVAVLQQGNVKTDVAMDEFPDGSRYNLRIQAIDEHGAKSPYVYSGQFSVLNTVVATDFQRLKGEMFIGTSDGRVMKAVESFWQIDEDWATGQPSPFFEEFKSGSPHVSITNGELDITDVSGSTYLLRQRKE